jgi:hypothetical protein
VWVISRHGVQRPIKPSRTLCYQGDPSDFMIVPDRNQPNGFENLLVEALTLLILQLQRIKPLSLNNVKGRTVQSQSSAFIHRWTDSVQEIT